MRVDPNDCSDAELIRAAGADAAAFGVLYERHALRVYTWSRRRLDWAASDLTAETFALAAMREVEIRLRSLAGASESDIGVNLAKAALKLDGPLADPNLDRGEQEATMALFWGAARCLQEPAEPSPS